MLNADLGVGCGSSGGCASNGCSRTPDFCIKRNDTRPSLKIAMTDCDGVVDLTDQNLILEANMWFEAKLKTTITNSSTVLVFADNIGFNQVLVGDIIIMDRPRDPEHMLVTDISESDKSITVQRAYNATVADSWSKGTTLRIFRFMDAPGEIESVFEQVEKVDGNSQEELVDTFLVFNWETSHTSLAGCYFLEFKILMVADSGEISWTKRVPLSEQGFLISVIDSPTPNL